MFFRNSSFEAGPGESSFGVDLERIEIGYAFGDWLNLRMGRFHTPLGYYANAFHLNPDNNTNKPFFARFVFKAKEIDGLGIGGSMYTSKVNGYSAANGTTPVVTV